MVTDNGMPPWVDTQPLDHQWCVIGGPLTTLSLVAHRRQATVGENLVVDRHWPHIRFPPRVANDGGLHVAYYHWREGICVHVGHW